MIGRLVSNLVLGFFVVTLVVVYGVAKQAPTYQVKQPAPQPQEIDQTQLSVLSEGVTSQLAVATTSKLVVPSGESVVVRVADDETERQQGLSGTDSLPRGEGMLFVFEKPGEYGIWMKDMNYDIDILWLDAEGRVVKVVENAPAPDIESQTWLVYKNAEPAMYVLELGAGEFARMGIALGDQIKVS